MLNQSNVTVRRKIKKFKITGSISDVQHKIRTCEGPSDQSITLVRHEGQMSILHRAQKLDIPIGEFSLKI